MAPEHDPPDGTLPASSDVLPILLQAGNLDRLVQEARKFLSREPGDLPAHYYATLGLVGLERFAEAKRHLDVLLSADPESVLSRYAAVRYFAARRKWRELARHSAEGMRIAPELAAFPHHAAIADLGRLRLRSAREHLRRARALDPEDPHIANLDLSVQAIDDKTPEDALKRLDDFAAALRLDPANAHLHHSLGRVCLDGLDDFEAAESHFREALRLDPAERIFQHDLFEAVARRSLVYRVFSLPSRIAGWLALYARLLARQPWRIPLVLLCAAMAGYVILAAAIWFAAVSLVFGPGGKVYEWLLVSEVRDAGAASGKALRWHRRLARIPRGIRFSIFLAANALVWMALFAWFRIDPGSGAAGLAAFVGLHFLITALFRWSRRTRIRRAGSRREPGPAVSERSRDSGIEIRDAER